MIPTITLQFITEIRQATWLRGVENDASARQRNLSLASCDLDFDLLILTLTLIFCIVKYYGPPPYIVGLCM